MERPTTTAPMALAAYAAISAVRRCSPGRMRNPASSGRCSVPAILPREYRARPIGNDVWKPAGGWERWSKDPAQRGVAVEDRVAAALQAVGAAETHVGGKVVAEHHLGAQLRAGAGVQAEGMEALEVVAVVERHPRVPDVAEDRSVQAAQVER